MAALLFLYGAWLRWSDGFVAVTTPDSFLFLSPALFDKFSEAGPRTFPYPLLIKICIEHLGGFSTIIFAQKAAGLATAALAFGAWTRLKGIIPYRLAGTILHDLLGLLVLSQLLLEHATMRYYEQAIMLESTGLPLPRRGDLFRLPFLRTAPAGVPGPAPRDLGSHPDRRQPLYL